MPEELWTEVRDTVQEAVIKTIPKKKKCNKAKWLSKEVLGILEVGWLGSFLNIPPPQKPTSLGIYSGEMEAHAHTQTWTALFVTAKSEITQISINR